jgi:hypothetical protein
MDIEYTIEVDDVIAWNLYYYAHSPLAKKQVRNAIITIIVLTLIILFIGITLLKDNEVVLALLSFYICLVLLIYIFLLRSSGRRDITKVTTNQYTTGKNAIIGRHILSITPENIRSVGESSESTSKWDIIEQVISTGEYLFMIFWGSSGAFIVPRKAFADDAAFNLFVETAKKYHQEATAAKTP